MNELQIFNFNNSEIRMASIDNVPWFVAKIANNYDRHGYGHNDHTNNHD